MGNIFNMNIFSVFLPEIFIMIKDVKHVMTKDLSVSFSKPKGLSLKYIQTVIPHYGYVC